MDTILRGSEKYLSTVVERQRNEKKMTYTARMVERANAVSIFDVLEDYFKHYVPHTGNSYKSRCPFAFEHSDGGMDKGFRTYPATNSSMCFPMHGYMPPVRLVQNKFGWGPLKSAEEILSHYGLLRPKNYRLRWGELMAERERFTDRIGNPQYAVTALHTALEQMPEYRLRQFDADVITAMERVLEALNSVVAENDPERLKKWYALALKLMQETVKRNP